MKHKLWNDPKSLTILFACLLFAIVLLALWQSAGILVRGGTETERLFPLAVAMFITGPLLISFSKMIEQKVVQKRDVPIFLSDIWKTAKFAGLHQIFLGILFGGVAPLIT